MKRKDQTRGIGLGLLAYTLWACGDTLNKLASEHGAGPLQAIAVSGFVGVVFLLIKTMAEHSLAALWPTSPKPIFIRAACNVCMAFCFYQSYARLPLANAYTMEFLSPFLIALGASIFLEEFLPKSVWVLIGVGFAGALIALHPSMVRGVPGIAAGYLFAFGGSAFFAASQLLMSHSSVTEKTEAVMFIPNLFLLLVGINGPSVLTLDATAIWLLLGMALLTIAGASIIIAASRLASASAIAPLQYSQIIPAACLGFAIWHTVPALHLIAGSLIIIIGGSVLLRRPLGSKQPSAPEI